MSLLRRLFGGSSAATPAGAPQATGDTTTAGGPAATGDAEAAYERELLREDAQRLSSDLIQRQLRYADRSWTPPAQGGEARATFGGDGSAGRDQVR